MADGLMHQFVVYGPNNVEHFGRFVVRKWAIGGGMLTTPDEPLILTDHHDQALDLLLTLQPHLCRIERSPQDDPCIIEIWI